MPRAIPFVSIFTVVRQDVLFCKWETRVIKPGTCLYINVAGKQQSQDLKSPALTPASDCFPVDSDTGSPLTHFTRA